MKSSRWFSTKGAALALAASVAAGIFAAGTAQAGAELPVVAISCGETIMQSIEVANDIGPCPGNGIIVGAPGIEIRFKNHSIIGTHKAGSVGIRNSFHNLVTIRQANVYNFEYGVMVAASKRNHLANIGSFGNTKNGFNLSDGKLNVLTDNIAKENGGHGFNAIHDNEMLLEDNFASANEGTGYFFISSDEGTLKRNRSTLNGRGMYLGAGNRFSVKKNELDVNEGDGLQVYSGGKHVFEANKMVNNKARGVSSESSVGNLFEGNEIRSNDNAGFFSTKGSANVLKANEVEQNAGHGIASTEADIKVKLNEANLNGFVNGAGDDFGLGISVPQTATGSGNVATGNDDPDQSSPASLLA